MTIGWCKWHDPGEHRATFPVLLNDQGSALTPSTERQDQRRGAAMAETTPSATRPLNLDVGKMMMEQSI